MLKGPPGCLASLFIPERFFLIKGSRNEEDRQQTYCKGNVFQEEQTKRRLGASLELDKRTNLTTDGIQRAENLCRKDDRGREVL